MRTNTCVHTLPFFQVDFVGARHCEARAYNMLKNITDDALFASKYLSYAQGFDLANRMPLFVHAPLASVAVNDTMWLMRTHFEGTFRTRAHKHTRAHTHTHTQPPGTWFDERSDVGAGPYHAEFRFGPDMWTSGKMWTHMHSLARTHVVLHDSVPLLLAQVGSSIRVREQLPSRITPSTSWPRRERTCPPP